MDVVRQLLHIDCHHLTFSIFIKLLAAFLQPPIFLYCFLLTFYYCGSQVLCYVVNRKDCCHYVSYGLGVQTLLCVVESNSKEWHEDLCLHGMGVQCVGSGLKMEFGNNNKYFLLPKSTRFFQGCLIFTLCKGTMLIGFWRVFKLLYSSNFGLVFHDLKFVLSICFFNFRCICRLL